MDKPYQFDIYISFTPKRHFNNDICANKRQRLEKYTPQKISYKDFFLSRKRKSYHLGSSCTEEYKFAPT